MNEALMTIGEFAEMLGSDIQIKGAPGIKFSSVSFDPTQRAVFCY